ncbi:MAG TPA: ABC transporter permease [Gemmatimonadales bacterium]|nr:ABC transporter permease [Gemmatimonadales bacterium]
MNSLFQNIRVSLRGFRRTPGFATTAIVTLALGIGLATGVFTVAHGLLLRRLPVDDQDRLVVLWGQLPDKDFDYPLGINDAHDFIRGARSLDRAAYYASWGAAPLTIREEDQITRLRRALVSGDFFDVLGARPVLGRALRPTDDLYGSAPVVVLSYAAWEQRFGRDLNVVGHQLVMYESGTPYTIVGVMPQGLDYPRGTEFWAPIATAIPPTGLQYVSLYVIGRLGAGATDTDARSELTSFLGRREAPTWGRDLRAVSHTLPRLVLGDVRPALLAFAAASVVILIITCINVANLLLVRGLARVREITVRSALGAGRLQLIGQLITENAVLALVGGTLGVGVAAAAVRAFIALAPAGMPRLDEINVNAPALLGALGITGLAVLLFGIAPAVVTSRVELQRALRSDARQSGGPRFRIAAETLVVGQVALALVVLSAAALIGKSLLKLQRAELHLEPSHLLIAELAVRSDQYDGAQKQRALLETIVSQIQSIPSVLGVSPVVAVPFAGAAAWDGRPAAEGQSAEDAAANPMLNMDVVAPQYFETLGIPLLRGRVFTDADREHTPAVVVVSQSAAQHYWGGNDPIGRRLKVGPKLDRTLTVIGVVADTRYRDLRDTRPSIYFPLRQSFFPFAPMTLAIRTSGPPAAQIAVIRRVITESAPGVELASGAPFADFLARPLSQPRLNAFLLAVFAGAAVVLAAVGLFGVMATVVRQRTRELGVRMALGATSTDLRTMVMRRGLAIAAVGSLLGLLGALLTNRFLVALLYDVAPTDMTTLMAATGFLVSIAAFASLIPARAATRIDAVVALRTE